MSKKIIIISDTHTFSPPSGFDEHISNLVGNEQALLTVEEPKDKFDILGKKLVALGGLEPEERIRHIRTLLDDENVTWRLGYRPETKEQTAEKLSAFAALQNAGVISKMRGIDVNAAEMTTVEMPVHISQHMAYVLNLPGFSQRDKLLTAFYVPALAWGVSDAFRDDEMFGNLKPLLGDSKPLIVFVGGGHTL
jgi:hypothetical protein